MTGYLQREDEYAYASPTETSPTALVASIMELARGATIETIPASTAEATRLAAVLPPATPVYVVALPGRPLDEIAVTATRLARAGLRPVPHLAARRFKSRDQFAALVAQLAGEAAVDEVLLIGGSVDRPAGPFHAAGQLMETGILSDCGIRRIGIAGHPEGHPSVPAAEMQAALNHKIALARDAGIDVHVVSQFCFDIALVADWLDGLVATLGDVPVRVGVPGPASITALVKYARLCEIGQSIRFLTRGSSALVKMATWSPEGFITGLADHWNRGGALNLQGMHFYTFGGTRRTAKWLGRIRDGAITLFPDGQGFKVG